MSVCVCVCVCLTDRQNSKKQFRRRFSRRKGEVEEQQTSDSARAGEKMNEEGKKKHHEAKGEKSQAERPRDRVYTTYVE